MTAADYHPRYLAGILLFNEQDYFAAHEVWEDLWMESHGLERKFYQGLIQAAVGLCHFDNGNLGGAIKLYHTSRAYMEPCGSPFLGLDVGRFWEQMTDCYRELLGPGEPDRGVRPPADRLPVIELDPAPVAWPDPMHFVPDEE